MIQAIRLARVASCSLTFTWIAIIDAHEQATARSVRDNCATIATQIERLLAVASGWSHCPKNGICPFTERQTPV
jgi:hypothetical protein